MTSSSPTKLLHDPTGSDGRVVAPSSVGPRPRVHGKFIYVGDQKLYLRGVTYGTFRPDVEGGEYGDAETVERDFERMAAAGVNAVRTYTVPPGWLLDAAQRHRLLVMVGLPWEQHVTFLDERQRMRSIEARVREGVRACAGHPAVLCYVIGNEIPAPIVRWHGRHRVEAFLRRLYKAAKSEDPGALVTYVNYPTTEYLQLPFLDFVCFNVFLERRERLESYLARLQNLSEDRPLVMTEIGLDSRRNGEAEQARTLSWQVSAAFAGGCAGTFVFSWTDEWHRGGFDVEDWDFGLTDRERQPKPALSAVQQAFENVPFPPMTDWPSVSVILCSYNGGATIGESLKAVGELRYPDYEVIVVDDGSTDATSAIAAEHDCRLISTDNQGLAAARNVGLDAAGGEIVAFIDDDAAPDADWLTFLAHSFITTDNAGVGGPNLAVAEDGPVAQCVAHAPGGATHVLLSDDEAEHIPGCNMAFRRAALEEIGGFDRRFVVAGDDVDVCWRLHARGLRLGFNPAAVVWHHRRPSVRRYWKQQRSYGKAEADLERKWPEKYTTGGHVTWRGRLYGDGFARRAAPRRWRIYYGTWGSGLFQSIYHPAGRMSELMPLLPEWYLVIAALALLSGIGLAWTPLLAALPLLVIAVGGALFQALLSSLKPSSVGSNGSRTSEAGLRALTAVLYLLQPLARLLGRIGGGLTPWRRRGAAGLSMPIPRSLEVWSEQWSPVEDRLESIERTVRSAGAAVIRGSDWDRWDLEVHGGPLGATRLRAAVEEHGGGRQLARFRLWPKISTSGILITLSLFALVGAAAASGAWLAAAIFGLITVALVAQELRECAAGMASAVQ
ncbi:MAG: glycosyltransferase, partial [Solirubrobacterales bacterium]